MTAADASRAREAATRERIAEARARGEAPGSSVIAPPEGGTSALASRRALVARAKELGIPASGKSSELEAAIAAAEAEAAPGAEDQPVEPSEDA